MSGKKSIITLVWLIIFVSTAMAGKSVYVISSTNANKVQAYKVDANSLTYQTDYDTSYSGPVGIAIDESEHGQFLFVTFEGTSEIELVNAKTMEYVDTVTAQTNNLAGIIVDKGRRKVYIIDRPTDHLYVYSWDAENRELTLDYDDPYYIELEDVSQGFGLALDEENGLLYIGDDTNNVKYYDTNDWSKKGQISLTDTVVGIAIDVPNQYLYTGASQFGDSYYLTQYEMNTSTENRVEVGSSVLGIAVDQDSNYVYITTYGDGQSSTLDRLTVYGSNLTKHWSSDDIGDPAGVAVGGLYKPPRFYLEKIDINAPNSVLPNDYITYEITYGPNGLDHNNVVLTDYLSYKVDFEDSDPNYNPYRHSYTWEIGDLNAADPNATVSLTVKVNEAADPNGTITNFCEIESDDAYNSATADTNIGPWEPNSNIIYVDDTSKCSPGTGMSWRSAYRDLQDALERASRPSCGSEIWVAAGTYKPTEPEGVWATFELVDGVGLYGGFAGTETSRSQRNWVTNETTLTGDSSIDDVVTGTDNTILDGFTITDGWYCGVKCYASDTNIVNCIVQNNRYFGIDCSNQSSVNITNCEILNNGQNYGYHGVRCLSQSSLNITNCQIQNNGGIGIYCNDSDLTVSNCTIEDNGSQGVNCANASSLTIINSRICDNNDHGINGSNIIVSNCIIEDNDDDGIYAGSDFVVANNKIRRNGGHGIDCQSIIGGSKIENNWIHNNGTDNGGHGICINYVSYGGVIIRNNTIVNNSTYGIELQRYSDVAHISNSIIWGNGNDANDNLYSEVTTFDNVTYSCIQDDTVYPGAGNINSDPLFYNPNDPNDYHLGPNSPCIDAGDPCFSDFNETDIDGECRIIDGDGDGNSVVDMGADEYDYRDADFNGNGVVNFLDYAVFANAWQTRPGDNNYNEDCNLVEPNSIDYNDLALFCEDWLWQPAWTQTGGGRMGYGMGVGSKQGQGYYQTVGTTTTSRS